MINELKDLVEEFKNTFGQCKIQWTWRHGIWNHHVKDKNVNNIEINEENIWLYESVSRR
jgi:hypothetical protein